MATDIAKANDSNDIKNGTMVVGAQVTGFTSSNVYDAYVKNTPALSDIESKYDERFDDPSYYYGIGGATIVGA